MSETLKISAELQKRVEAIAARSSLTPAEIVADALEHGRSLDWQERFLDMVDERIAAADRGEFASAAEIERVLNKYRPV